MEAKQPLSDSELRSALADISYALSTILTVFDMLLQQTQETSINADATRRALAAYDSALGAKIRDQYQGAIAASKPVIDETRQALAGLAHRLKENVGKLNL